jgi:hypothetical protein
VIGVLIHGDMKLLQRAGENLLSCLHHALQGITASFSGLHVYFHRTPPPPPPGVGAPPCFGVW